MNPTCPIYNLMATREGRTEMWRRLQAEERLTDMGRVLRFLMAEYAYCAAFNRERHKAMPKCTHLEETALALDCVAERFRELLEAGTCAEFEKRLIG